MFSELARPLLLSQQKWFNGAFNGRLKVMSATKFDKVRGGSLSIGYV
jgi:hypothetical protein